MRKKKKREGEKERKEKEVKKRKKKKERRRRKRRRKLIGKVDRAFKFSSIKIMELGCGFKAEILLNLVSSKIEIA